MYPAISAATTPVMIMIPPIVGVPSLFLCQVGPISLIVWPNFSFLSQGIIA